MMQLISILLTSEAMKNNSRNNKINDDNNGDNDSKRNKSNQ